MNDLLGQQVQMTFLDLPVLLPQIKAGTLRPIALGAPERAPTALEVPTTAEAGMPGLIIENWYGMVAPAATPPAIVASPEQDHDRSDGRSDREGKARGPGRDAGRRYAGAFPRLHRQRNQEVGEGDQGRGGRDDEVSVHDVAALLLYARREIAGTSSPGALTRLPEALMKALRVLLTGLSVLLPAVAAAQDFPSKPIRLIVPFPPGGPNDIIARVVGQRMSEITKQPVLIDNRGGQAGVLGTDAIAKAAPDGYTIGIVSASSLVINPTMEKVPYDVAKDFAPVTLVTTVPEMLVVASNVPASNMKELIALAKAQPGKLNFASAGVGGLPHLAGELLKLTAKHRHRARALSGRCARHQRSARPAGADGVPRFAGAAAAYQGRHPAPDRARRAASARPPRPTCRPPRRSACPIS